MSTIIGRYLDVDRQIKELTKEKVAIRDMILKESNDRNTIDVYSRDTKHIEFPKTVIKTEKILNQHILDNFSTWDMTDFIEEQDCFSVFLRKKAEFSSGSFEADGFVVERKVVSGSPEINWDSLQRENPDIVNKISKEIMTRVIDEDGFAKAVYEDSSLIPTLERHIKEGTPSNRVTVKPIKTTT